ncbi:NUDIX domain-containing protein [Prolixibacteraceae bacterium Z1-6]|uniref:8-oxo-dGTP diphosphatase n=1 Tax=Draconibacterium aestuarii TaxID=2998507 RepID=A0A9X3J6B8_9BACT|nr:NUDIX domain-containing protein [Prolixibacteraceae bacterium Z1-6]
MIQVACALIIHDGKVLLAQNGSNSDHHLQWEFPGGKIKPDETEEQCIRREIREELELEIEIVDSLKAVVHDYNIKKIRLIPFICKLNGGNLKLNDHINAEWVELNDLFEYDLSEADKKLIEIHRNQKILKKYIWK